MGKFAQKCLFGFFFVCENLSLFQEKILFASLQAIIVFKNNINFIIGAFLSILTVNCQSKFSQSQQNATAIS
jgi:hypothetical protein